MYSVAFVTAFSILQLHWFFLLNQITCTVRKSSTFRICHASPWCSAE